MDIPTIVFLREYFLYMVLVAGVGYLLGSICFSIIFTKFFKDKVDIRNLGSGNAGFTNVLRSVGILPALLTMLGDLFKGILACLIGQMVFSNFSISGVPQFCIIQYGIYLSGVCCVIGHIYPCFFKFKGGKAVLTAFALIIMTDLRVALVLLLVFVIIVFATRIVSLGSIIAALLYPILTFITSYFYDYLGGAREVTFGYVVISTTVSAFIGLIVMYKHKSNILRIMKGQEKKFSIAK